MLESKKFPREILLRSFKPNFEKKVSDIERQCTQLAIDVQNEGLNIRDICEKMWKTSNELKRLSTDGSFNALIASIGGVVVFLFRLIGVLLSTGRRNGSGKRAQRVLKEARRLSSAVDKAIKTGKLFMKQNREMEAKVRDLEFLNGLLKDRQARLSRLIDRQNALGCRD